MQMMKSQDIYTPAANSTIPHRQLFQISYNQLFQFPLGSVRHYANTNIHPSQKFRRARIGVMPIRHEKGALNPQTPIAWIPSHSGCVGPNHNVRLPLLMGMGPAAEHAHSLSNPVILPPNRQPESLPHTQYYPGGPEGRGGNSPMGPGSAH